MSSISASWNGAAPVVFIYRNNTIVNMFGGGAGVGEYFGQLFGSATIPQDGVSSTPLTLEVGDRVDVYAYAEELGFTLVGMHDVVEGETEALHLDLTFPKKFDESAYTWFAGRTTWARIPNLGWYAGLYAGHNYANVLNAPDGNLVVTWGSSVFFFYPPGTQGEKTITVFDVEYTASSEMYDYTWKYTFGDPELVSVTCVGATSVLSYRTAISESGLARPIDMPFNFENELFSAKRCSYEPPATVTFLRGTQPLEHQIAGEYASISYESAMMQIFVPLGASLSLSGCDYSMTSAAYDTYTLTGYVGDIVTYTLDDVTGSIILTNDNETIDLREQPVMVILTVIAPSGFLASSTSGTITSGETDVLVINGHPGHVVTIGCTINDTLVNHVVTIPGTDTTLDWVTSPWWATGGGTPEPEDPGTFTPEARLEKIHCVNYGDAGDISLRVRKAGIIKSYEIIDVPSGEHDYIFDIETYGYSIWFEHWGATQFWAEVTLPNGTHVINEPWPEVSTQWSVIYGTPSPSEGGEGSELGFITVANPTDEPVTLSVRTNGILSTFDAVGVVDPRSTVSYPILDSYLSPLTPGIVRCRLVGANGTLERDYVYPDSHLIFIEYPSSAIQTGNFDWEKLLKYGAIGIGALAVLSVGLYLLGFLRKTN